ncbi:MAG: glycoside hydrolase family 3 protein [Pseudomonadales bacterium]
MLTEEQNKQLQQLMSSMTLAQKIGQMTMAERMWATPDDVREHGLGSILSGGGSAPGENTAADWVEMNDAYWQACMQAEGGVGVPILFAVDAVHGHNNLKGATLFPHNLGLGAADEPELVAKIAEVTAKEVLATGLEWNFAPTLAVVQDIRWGRTYESFGSDPKRAARYGEAYVKACQAEGVLACVKHWVGDGATHHGIDQGDTRLDYETLESTHMTPYYPALQAGVLSVMVSFNSWNGDKCHGSRFLVTEVLKEKLGFSGIVVSDWDGIDYLSEDYGQAIRDGVNAGLDLFMVPENWRLFLSGLAEQVELGHVSESRIDDAVSRILGTKIKMGLLEKPRPAERIDASLPLPGCAAHRSIAREAVRKSLVLLKNEQQTLPIRDDQRILVAGKGANNLGQQCGGWTVSWQGEPDGSNIEGTTIWQAVSGRAPNAVLSEGLDGSDADAAKHDVALVVIGETPYAEGLGDVRFNDEGLIQTGSMIQGLMKPLEPYGQSLALADLHPEDLACIRHIRDSGVPVVAVLVSGRPLVIEQELEESQAFVAAWLPGTEGDGVADVLFGDYSFTAKLPLPWPTGEGLNSDRSAFEAGFGMDLHPSVVDSAVEKKYKLS